MGQKKGKFIWDGKKKFVSDVEQSTKVKRKVVFIPTNFDERTALKQKENFSSENQ